MKKVVSILILLLLVLLPFITTKLFSPSLDELEKEKCINIGALKAENELPINVYLCFGDVFRPNDLRSDIGFDLVILSCYFDPIDYNGEQILFSNPLLNSALSNTAKDSTELYSLIYNLFLTLDKSRNVISCYAQNIGNSIPCKGDKITPYIWSVSQSDNAFSRNNIKYLCALPILNPHTLFNENPKKVRETLAENVDAAIKRLLNNEMDLLRPTVKSIAIAAIGSTSHSGDSELFMSFKQGFLTIIKSISQSRPPETFDRVYLVAFDKHKGQFKKDALFGLKAVAEYLILKKITSDDYFKLISFIYLILWTLLTFIYYKNSKTIWIANNRFAFVLTLTSVGGLLTAMSFGFTSVLINQISIVKFEQYFVFHGLIVIIDFLLLLIMGKWILRKSNNTKHAIYKIGV